jgi:muramidase (phage lysozyme)
MTKYEKALLDLIAYTEGTLGVSQNGYDVAINFHTIIGWTENTTIVHGEKAWRKPVGNINSSAAGRYQILGKTWRGGWVGGTESKPGPNKPMTKDNQDAAALWLINKRLKNTNIDSRSVTTSELENRAKFDIALQKLAPEWASLPLTKTFTSLNGNIHFAGSSYYASDGTNKADHSPDDLYRVFKKALALYS